MENLQIMRRIGGRISTWRIEGFVVRGGLHTMITTVEQTKQSSVVFTTGAAARYNCSHIEENSCSHESI